MDLEIRDPVFFSVRHRGPDVAKYQRKLKNSNFPHVFMGRRPGINNFLRRASEHGRYFMLVPLPVRASGSVPTWKYLFREP